MKTIQKAPGSLQDTVDNRNLPMEEVFMDVEHVILVDTSMSMNERDCEGNKSRHEIAEMELKNLQKDLPGKIAVISFSDKAVFCPTGIPLRQNGCTYLCSALEYIQDLDDTDVKFYILCDGYPTNEERTKKIAAEFVSPLNCIFIGPDSDKMGMEFMNLLANLTNGKSLKSGETGHFEKEIRMLMAGCE